MKISHMIISLCQSGISSDGLKCWNNQQHGIYIIKSDPQHCLDNFFFSSYWSGDERFIYTGIYKNKYIYSTIVCYEILEALIPIRLYA